MGRPRPRDGGFPRPRWQRENWPSARPRYLVGNRTDHGIWWSTTPWPRMARRSARSVVRGPLGTSCVHVTLAVSAWDAYCVYRYSERDLCFVFNNHFDLDLEERGPFRGAARLETQRTGTRRTGSIYLNESCPGETVASRSPRPSASKLDGSQYRREITGERTG